MAGLHSPSMLFAITRPMGPARIRARAVAESPAHKVLIPVAKCGAHIAGLPEKPLAQYIADAAELIRGLL